MSYEHDGKLLDALTLYREAVGTIGQLSVQFTADGARTQYLEADNRLAVDDALAALLLKLHGQDSTRGYEREALATIEAKKNRIAADALASARPQSRIPGRAQSSSGPGWKAIASARWKRALTAEHLTKLVAKTKSEYLALVRLFSPSIGSTFRSFPTSKPLIRRRPRNSPPGSPQARPLSDCFRAKTSSTSSSWRPEVPSG